MSEHADAVCLWEALSSELMDLWLEKTPRVSLSGEKKQLPSSSGTASCSVLNSPRGLTGIAVAQDAARFP